MFWRFDPVTLIDYALVTQWTRVPRFERGGREFESLRGCQILFLTPEENRKKEIKFSR